MDIFVGVIVGLLVLMTLVVLHEFGHFIAARRNGVNVLEFGIGFPPRAVAWVKDPKTHKWRRLKKSEWNKESVTKAVGFDKKTAEAGVKGKNTKSKIIADGLIFSINWLPIGGFCQMDGESAEDERPGTFGNANFWKKTKILFAGVTMNWLTAFAILTILAWTGMPTFLDNQFTIASDTKKEQEYVIVSEVLENSPAAAAGFKTGDKIVGSGETVFHYASDVTAFNNEHVGEKVTYDILRTDSTECDCAQEPCDCPAVEQILHLSTQLNSKDSEYLLGVAMSTPQTLAYSTWSAPIVGAGLTLQMTGETFKGVGQLVWNLIRGIGLQFSLDGSVRDAGREAISEVGESVSGPVGIIGVLFPTFTAAGPSNLAFLAALISISLACMNVLPIPALDGGRWLLMAIFKLRHKRLTKEIEEKVVSRAFIVLLALMFIVTILDVIRLF